MFNLGESELLQIAEYQLLGGDLQSAKLLTYQALKINASSWKANALLAKIYNNLNEDDSALEALARATQYPECPAHILYEYGSICLSNGNYSAAINTFTKILITERASFEVFHDIGVALALSGEQDRALEKFEMASSINPNSAELHYNIGCLYDCKKRLWDAISRYKSALILDPQFISAWINLSIDQAQLKDYPEALKSLEHVLTLNPSQDYILGDIALLKMRMCDWAGINKLIQAIKDKILLGHNVITPFASLCLIDQPKEILDLTKRYATEKFPENKVLGEIKNPEEGDIIKVAYFSSDFYKHPVAFLTAEIFELHDRSKFEIHAFSLTKNESDPLTKRLEKSFDYFHHVDNLTDIEVTRLARNLSIDIAVDLNGHTDHMRLGIFAARCAPIQVSYVGYLGTMGASYFDYLIADPAIIAPREEQHYSEEIVFLRNYYTRDTKNPRPNNEVAPREEFNLPKNKFIYCSFNNNYKITPAIFLAWMKILKASQNSILLIYAENAWSKYNLSTVARLEGIEPDRIIFTDYAERSEYLSRLAVCDLFLDTFPYNAGTTANDALWMGLPVLTLSGEVFQARIGSSLLSSLDLKELVTTNLNQYIETAIHLSHEPTSLLAIKHKLKVNSISHALFKPSVFTEDIEKAYEVIWRRHISGLPPKSFYN